MSKVHKAVQKADAGSNSPAWERPKPTQHLHLYCKVSGVQTSVSTHIPAAPSSALQLRQHQAIPPAAWVLLLVPTPTSPATQQHSPRCDPVPGIPYPTGGGKPGQLPLRLSKGELLLTLPCERVKLGWVQPGDGIPCGYFIEESV